jgi:hypothetical protein
MNPKNDMSERFGKCRFLGRTEPAFAAVRKLHKKRFDLNEFTIKSGASEEMVLVRYNHLRRVLLHSSVVEPNRFVSLGGSERFGCNRKKHPLAHQSAPNLPGMRTLCGPWGLGNGARCRVCAHGERR